MTGSCNSRWRLTTILDYSFVDIFVKSHYNESKFGRFVPCRVLHVGLYFREYIFWNDWNIQDGVQPPSFFYSFVNNFVKSQYEKLKICWFVVSCKVIHVGLYFHKFSFSSDWKIQDGFRTTILEYYFVNNFVKSHNKKLKFCWFVSCKVFHVGLYFRDCSFWDDCKIQDGVRTTILEYCFVKHFVETAHNMLMRGLHDPTVGQTGRSNSWINSCVVWTVVQPVGPTGWMNQTCQIHPTGWTKSCIVKTSIQLSKADSWTKHASGNYWRVNLLTYYANEVPNQPIESMYNDDASNDVIFRLCWTYIFEHSDSLMEYRRNHKIQLYRIKWNHNINPNILIIFTHREICILRLDRLLIFIVFFWFIYSQGRCDTLSFTLAGVPPTVGPTVGPTVTSTI